MVYSVEQLQAIIAPIAVKYQLPAVYLFGSYARGEANENSDIDLLIDTSGTELTSLMKLGALYCELQEVLHKTVDLITVSSLEQTAQMPSEVVFKETVKRERVSLYAAA
ncbi:MAG: nucleotidyltransferase domain-containing protein [Oscillospiraceae bacterium]|nr:nucleotidyltransferase domain-containing protein [Oscillospiraceae bacterium]